MLLPRLYRLIYQREPPYYIKRSIPLLMWKTVRKFMSVVIAPMLPFNSWRLLCYRLVGFKIGKRCFIGMRCYLDDVVPHLTRIGDDVVISYCCRFAVHEPGHPARPINIEDQVFIGVGVTLIAGREGITVGKGAVIGAASLVNKSIPPGKVAAGVPARTLGEASLHLRARRPAGSDTRPGEESAGAEPKGGEAAE